MPKSAPATQPDSNKIQTHLYLFFSLVLSFPDVHTAGIRMMLCKVSVSAIGMVYGLYQKDYQVAAVKIAQWILW